MGTLGWGCGAHGHHGDGDMWGARRRWGQGSGCRGDRDTWSMWASPGWHTEGKGHVGHTGVAAMGHRWTGPHRAHGHCRTVRGTGVLCRQGDTCHRGSITMTVISRWTQWFQQDHICNRGHGDWGRYRYHCTVTGDSSPAGTRCPVMTVCPIPGMHKRPPCSRSHGTVSHPHGSLWLVPMVPSCPIRPHSRGATRPMCPSSCTVAPRG